MNIKIHFSERECRSEEDRDTLHRYMSHVASSDLDWESKLRAIDFWQYIIQECFTLRGLYERWCTLEDEPDLPQYSILPDSLKLVLFCIINRL